MKTIVQEYGLIILSVAALFICMAFGNRVFNYNIFDTTIDNVATLNGAYKPGTILHVDGYNGELIVMKRVGVNRYLVMIKDSIGKMKFDDSTSTYENSYIDNYLENTWYKNLPTKLQSAIVPKDIYQDTYKIIHENSKWKYFDPYGKTGNLWYHNEATEDTPKWEPFNKTELNKDDEGVYTFENFKTSKQSNTYKRHIYLPSFKDLNKMADMSKAKNVQILLGSNYYQMWLRDNFGIYGLYLYTCTYSPYSAGPKASLSIHPSFVIDSTKVKTTAIDIIKFIS